MGVFCILQEMVSQLQPQEGAQERHRKTKFIITYRILKRQSGHALRYPHSGVHQGSGALPSSYENWERVRACGPTGAFMGVRVAHTSKKHEGISLLCMIVTSPQSGDLVGVTGISTRVLTVCLWGYGSSRNIRSFNIYSTWG